MKAKKMFVKITILLLLVAMLIPMLTLVTPAASAESRGPSYTGNPSASVKKAFKDKTIILLSNKKNEIALFENVFTLKNGQLQETNKKHKTSRLL